MTETLATTTRTVDYSYDGLLRLTGATESGATTTSYTYTYDLAGNRTSATANGTTTTQSYNAANQVIGWSDDAAGNLLTDGTTTYGYDALNRLVTQDSTANVYNGDGVLVQRGATQYAQDLVAPLSQVLTDGSATYVYGHERLTALGSVRATLDSAGAVQATANDAPFGEPQGSSIAPFGFTGEFQDQGLVNLRARWYHPRSGTFTGVDPFAGWDEIPNSLHPYSYAGNNPVLWTDPSGACYGPFCSFRNVKATKCRDLDKAMYIWYSPRASQSQKALAFSYISTWSFGAVAAVAAVPVTAAATASVAGASAGTIGVGLSFGAAFDLIGQRVTQGSWSEVDGLQTVFSASTGAFGTGVGSAASRVPLFQNSFWGRVAFSSGGSGLVGAGMTYLNNIFSCEPTNLRDATVWSAVLGGAGSGIGQRLAAASAAQASRVTLSPYLFGTRQQRLDAIMATQFARIQIPKNPSPYTVGAGTILGEATANAAPLGQLIEFIVSPDASFDETGVDTAGVNDNISGYR